MNTQTIDRSLQRCYNLSMKTILILALFLLAACQDYSGDIRVAPSAHSLYEDAVAMGEELNDRAGVEVFNVKRVGSEERVNGEITIIARDRSKDIANAGGHTSHYMVGGIISVVPGMPDCALAHEMLHGIGLEHSKDPKNIMYDGLLYCDKDGNWGLTSKQIKYMKEFYESRVDHDTEAK